MASAPLTIAVVSRHQTARDSEELDAMVGFLKEQPGVLLAGVCSIDEFAAPPEAVAFVLVLGGDGTILRTCRQLAEQQRPMLGINLGRLGFLADLSPSEFRQNLIRFQRGEYVVVKHLMFEVTHHRADGTCQKILGLNEIAVLSGAAFQLLQVRLCIDGEPVTTYSCDGLIISTPVGSTAHSMAAGGPILRQDLRAFVITPISPHTLTNRPLVDRAECVYTLTLPDAPEGATLVIDGQTRWPLSPSDRIELRAADVSFQLARLPNHSYYATLHRKLGWGGQANLNYPR